MNYRLVAIIGSIVISSCSNDQAKTFQSASNPLIGTWQLVSGTLIEKGDTSTTYYTGDTSFIKIINESHFAFLQHDNLKGKDTAKASFVAGGGTYDLSGNTYTERLQYCSARNWEGADFKFTVSFSNDTLTQQGVEQVAGENIDRLNIEKYVRVKN